MKLIHKYKDILFLLFLSILVPLLWYGLDPNTLITSHDVGSSLNPVEFVKTRLFAWHGGTNLGRSQIELSGSLIYYGSEALATFLTGSVFVGQRIVVIFWFFLPMLVMYIVLRKIPPFAKKSYMALLAAILFQFNHYQQHGWRVFWRTRFSTYILLPLILLLLIDYLEGRRKLFKTSIIIGLLVFFLNGGGSPPLFGAVILLILFTIIYYLFINLRNKFLVYFKKSILFILVVGVVSFIISSFWTLPYLYHTLSSYSQIIQSIGGLSSTIAWTDVVSLNTSILALLRNVGLPFWDTSQGDPHLFLTNPVLIIGSFVWPILTFSSLFFAEKREEKKYILLFLVLTMVGLLFTAGTHKPFREFYIFLLKNIPGYVIFRSPLYKFGNLLWFSYAVLIAFSISSIIEKMKVSFISSLHLKAGVRGIYNRLRKKSPLLLAILFIFFIFLWDYAIFNSQFFIFNPPLSTMEKIPSYVFDYRKWMDKQNDFSVRTLLLPELNYDWRTEIYRWGYSSFGSQLFPLLTSKNTIANDVSASNIERVDIIINGLYELLKKNNPSWLTLAKELNIRYLLLRNDYFHNINWATTTSPGKYKQILEQNDKVEKIETFGEWDIYRIKTDVATNKIYIEAQPIFYQAQADDMLHLFSLINQKYQGENENILFVSADWLDARDNNKSIVVIPGPIKIFSPIGKEGLDLPKPKFLPNSPLYFFIENNERGLLKKANKPEKRSDIYIRLSLNRLAELNELIKIEATLREIENVADRYILLLNDIKQNLNELLKSKKDVSYFIIHTKGFLMEERKLIKRWADGQKSQFIKNILEKTYHHLEEIIKTIPVSKEQERVLKSLIQNYDDPNIVFLTKEYQWKIPYSGFYEIYLKNDTLLRNSNNLRINIGDQSVGVELNRNKNGQNWQKITEINLDKGNHGLEIIVDGDALPSFKKGDIVFIKNSTKDEKINSDIYYRRINPTKYLVRISTDTPIFLVLDEEFNTGWKVYLKEKSDQDVDYNQADVSLLHFIDKIRKVMDEYLFNTLFLKPLPEGQHLKVNGYANAWYIKGSSNIKGEEFEAVIEYLPQRVFYLSFLVTIVAVSTSIGYLFISRQKH